MFEFLNTVVMSNIKRVAKRYPTLRRLVEIEVLNGNIGRRIYRKTGPVIFGTVTVFEEKDKNQINGAIVSENLPLTQELRASIGSDVDTGNLRLLVATSERCGRLGQVLVSYVELARSIATGYVFSLKVSLGARGMGIGRQLLDAVEKQARNDRIARLGAIVDTSNIRSLGLFKAIGYQIISSDEIEKRLHREQITIPEGKLLLEKLL